MPICSALLKLEQHHLLSLCICTVQFISSIIICIISILKASWKDGQRISHVWAISKVTLLGILELYQLHTIISRIWRKLKTKCFGCNKTNQKFTWKLCKLREKGPCGLLSALRTKACISDGMVSLWKRHHQCWKVCAHPHTVFREAF